MSEPYARCYDCGWETRVEPYRSMQGHLEERPEHHAYVVGDGGWA